VAVKIKLKRMGKIREPFYRIVVADARTKRDGRAIEEVGKYNPKLEPSLIEVNSDRVQHWLGVGAQPTDPVRHLLTITGDWQKFKGEPGAEGTLKVAEPKANKKDRYDSLVQESFAAKEAKEKDGKGAKKEPARSRAKKSDDAKAETKAETKTDAKADAKADGKTDAKAKAEPKTDAKAEPKSDAKAEAKAEAKADAKADAETTTETAQAEEVKAEDAKADGGSEA
jgi:small subunit ribosomal protein S16